MLAIRKLTVPEAGATDLEMTDDNGNEIRQGINGVPGMVNVVPGEGAPTAGIAVTIKDGNGVVFFEETGISEGDDPFKLSDMKTDLIAGRPTVTCDEPGTVVLLYVDE